MVERSGSRRTIRPSSVTGSIRSGSAIGDGHGGDRTAARVDSTLPHTPDCPSHTDGACRVRTSPPASTRSSPSTSRSTRCRRPPPACTPTTADGPTRPRPAVARLLAFYDRWAAELRGVRRRRARPRTSGSTATCSSASWRPIASGEAMLREETWSPLEWVYMLGDGLFPLIAREFAPLADRLASVASRLEGMPAMLDAAREPDRLRRPTRSRASTREKALEQLGGHRRADRRRPGARRARRPPAATRTSPRSLPGLACRGGRGATRRSTAFETPPPGRRPARVRGRGPARRGAVRGEDGPHRLLDGADAGSDQGPRRAGVRRGPGRDDPDRPRDLAGRGAATPRRPTDDGEAVRAVLDAIAVAAPGSRTTSSTSAGRSSPGSRRSAASATSSAWPTSRSRSAGRRCSCARSAGRCSTRRGRSTAARRRSSR